MKIMLCGASDLNDNLPFFKRVASEMGFEPLNYLSGEVYYHQYGEDNWTSNSRLTVESADVIVFVINSGYGKITWKDELPKTIESGKNFLILCRKETYDLYLLVKDGKVKPATDESSSLIKQIEEMENGYQITIVPYVDLSDFSQKLKTHINGLYKIALNALQLRNQRATILPLLKLGNIQGEKFNPLQIKIAKEILFDVFEPKELRKRALNFLIDVSALSEDEIANLLVDVESGIARKTVVDLPRLVRENHDIDSIFKEVISCCIENEVGFVRRAIRSLIEIDISLAIKYLPALFPVQDIGTPRRIVTFLYERAEALTELCQSNTEYYKATINLLKLCIGYKTEEKDWKERAQILVDQIEDKIINN
ncbi:hypothetical protein KKF34_15995 [Myxococcota bacterium]|nr:hypothetical protein [Myxococcota bacterium]MBU1381376.1 hypothetical protein [Myxococcota bacterium]MBU1498379.1 hypothetical protein [Myxococcota bacterium]